MHKIQKKLDSMHVPSLKRIAIVGMTNKGLRKQCQVKLINKNP